MKDYSIFIAAAYMLTSVVLGGLVLHSLLQARRAEKEAAVKNNA